MKQAQHIVIVGGGTAGWMAANLMAQRWAGKNVELSLLESADIGIVGVGEGSTPQLKAFFDSIGVAEADWMPACNATYKVGIEFAGWSAKTGFRSYFHPFPAQTDTQNYQACVYNCYLRRQGLDVHAHPDRFFVPARLAQQRLGPIPDHRFPFPVAYGYHFDSHLLGQYLRTVAEKRGVRHIEGKVAQVGLADNGAIATLQLTDGRQLAGDFFVDSTGFRSLLLQQALAVPFLSFSQNLFNDAAVVLPTACAPEPNCHTISTAMQHGWSWEIPLTHRTGNGYVYSSAFCSGDEAETELRGKLGLLDSDVDARHLQMKVGQVEKHWHRNCLAVGLSQGFIEPLEATALHIVLETVEQFMACFEEGDFSDRHQQRFNDRIRQRFEGVRDYIVCHYRINSRGDTDYWRANAANEHLSDSLKRIFRTWLDVGDLTVEIQQQDISKYYNSISWHCILAGYGIFPDSQQLRPCGASDRRYDMAKIDDFVERCALNFKPHAEQLAFDAM